MAQVQDWPWWLTHELDLNKTAKVLKTEITEKTEITSKLQLPQGWLELLA